VTITYYQRKGAGAARGEDSRVPHMAVRAEARPTAGRFTVSRAPRSSHAPANADYQHADPKTRRSAAAQFSFIDVLAAGRAWLRMLADEEKAAPVAKKKTGAAPAERRSRRGPAKRRT
jgi:hypothetical protein